MSEYRLIQRIELPDRRMVRVELDMEQLSFYATRARRNANGTAIAGPVRFKVEKPKKGAKS